MFLNACSLFCRLVTKPYDADMLKELDRMGRIHTPKGGKTSINVELIHMQALLAFLQDALIDTIFAYKNSSDEGKKLGIYPIYSATDGWGEP